MNDDNQFFYEIYYKLAALLLPQKEIQTTSPNLTVISESIGKFIDPNDFQDPHVPQSPNLANEVFADLVNDIPSSNAFFSDTGRNIDQEYRYIIETAQPAYGLVADNVAEAAAKMLANSQREIAMEKRASLRDPSWLYLPAYATPSRWWDQNSDSWASFEFKLGSLPRLSWRTHNLANATTLSSLARKKGIISFSNFKEKLGSTKEPTQVKHFQKLRLSHILNEMRHNDYKSLENFLSPETRNIQIKFQYCPVEIERPWLDYTLFSQPGWLLPGLPPHFISTGTFENNHGSLPLIPTKFLVIRNLEIEANWSEADLAKANSVSSPLGTISFGPFGLNETSTFSNFRLHCPGLQIVAWLCAITPDCPQISTDRN